MTGTARARRSLAARPDGPFSAVTVSAPGELMQIDSTPFDVLGRLATAGAAVPPVGKYKVNVVPVSGALATGFVPFIVPDLLKLLAAAAAMPGLWWITGTRGR